MSRTEITRLPEKGNLDRGELDRLLDSVHIAHFAVVASDGHPAVLPTAIARDRDAILLHGSTASRWMRLLADGRQTSLAVTAVDGLVVARSAFESSMHYRSAVLFGTCQIVDGDQKLAAVDLITDVLVPGRVAEIRRPTARELAATLVLRFTIDEWSLKISADWPDDPDDDVGGRAWAGVLTMRTEYIAAHASPDLSTGIVIPPSVRRLLDRDSALS
jgi:nitroimidazol reductase NimA-like FMN-containing flavoprotein (pyridoxamine 5'-phosphate oxidase superfamily)